MKKTVLTVLLAMLLCMPAWAANKVYIAPEASRTWTDAGTGGDELLDAGGLAAAALVMGSFHDLGSASRADTYNFEMFIDAFDTDPVVGETVDLYFCQSNATTNFGGIPGTDPTTTVEGAITLDEVKNCMFAGSASVHTTTAASAILKITGLVRLTSRYVAPVIHNNTADALLSTSDAHLVVLVGVPSEVQ